MKTLDAEVFAVGKWNGMPFTAEDLLSITAAFDKLGDNLRVPLKFGHNDEQAMTDGKPALGWVEKVWVAGDKLMARFVDLPQVVFNAIQKKLYRNVSIELDFDVQHKGNRYPLVLSGVALLGADIPAVSTLKELTHYLSRGADFSVGRTVMFSAIAGHSQTKEKMMELQELIDKVAKLTANVSDLTAANATLTADKASADKAIAQFTADAKARDEAAAKAAVTAKRTAVTQVLEDGVKSEAITPAQREQFTKLMRVDDDASVLALDIEEVKKLTANGKKQFSKEQGHQGNGAQESELSVPAQVVAECKAMIAKGEAKNFAAAQAVLFTRNPELARAYVSFNDKE